MLDGNAGTVDTDDSTTQSTELTDLPGVGPKRASALSEAGFERVDEIVAASLLTLTRSTQLGERTCRCIWAVANEACESEGTLLANLADGLDVPRSEVATAYGDLAPVGIPPEEAVGSLIEWFTPSPLAEALQEGGYSIRYYHMLGEEGFETPSDVTEASVDALTAAQYVGDSVAAALRETVEDWTETDETPSQGHEGATGETAGMPTTDPDDGTEEDSGQCEEPARHSDPDTPGTDSTGQQVERPAAQQAQPNDTERVPKARAQELLERSIGSDAEFRPQQWKAIDRLVNDNDRLLLVQRTGWGKSTVYFTATKLRREQGAGPTLIVSPLLSLIR
ncbi:helix-hairpin-helix domain-containing protein [Halorubrum sp. AS12]|uniref:helix-hairpin-helix domain-containing protein n=1 Tax=Halorubrum sp. AS12 TaxID=3409687 RepID=UPI003DA6ED38